MLDKRLSFEFFLASQQSKIQSLKALLANAELVVSVSNLIHELQRERGLSNLYLASAGLRYHDKMLEQHAQADHALNEFNTQLDSLGRLGEGRFCTESLYLSLAYACEGLSGLDAMRTQVEQQLISANATCLQLSRVIAHLLSVIFEAADISNDPKISKALVALFNFMQSKEYAGQERAWALIGFAQGSFSREDLERLLTLEDKQTFYVDIFADFADNYSLQAWESLLDDPISHNFTQLRGVLHRLTEKDAVPTDLSEVWYEASTERINAMQDIEKALSDALKTLCCETLTSVSNALNEREKMVQTLHAQAEGGQLDPSNRLTNGDWVSLYGEDSNASDLTRSVYALLHQQTEELRQLSVDLEVAKKALSDRKLVDRAKSILMRHSNLDEQQAHRELQKSSMVNNKSMVEVAQALIVRFERLGVK
jgi:hypothetical protein